jgi:hypothetical protein
LSGVGDLVLIVVAAAVVALASRDGDDQPASQPVAAAPPPAGGLHDVSSQAVDAARGGIQERSAGAFEEYGPPPGVLPEGAVGAQEGGAPGKSTKRFRPTSARYLTGDVGLAARRALNAVAVTIQVAPQVFSDFKTPCTHITPVLAAVSGPIMAGQFKDGSGGCYLWLNLLNTADIPAPDLCKLVLHELGHLSGLEHSKDKAEVMYSPFLSQPVVPACSGRASASQK